ncbi:MAG: hypothetical protein WAX69_22345 [Victivallales bacterium]
MKTRPVISGTRDSGHYISDAIFPGRNDFNLKPVYFEDFFFSTSDNLCVFA